MAQKQKGGVAFDIHFPVRGVHHLQEGPLCICNSMAPVYLQRARTKI
jgi:hypothetical protein